MLNAGQLIWISLRPLIRLVLTAGCGFAITKADIFPAVAARGAGQIMLNIALPCLMFSKIVPAFNSDNINALGPLVLVAVLYEIIGIAIAWIIKQFFWVPHRFRYGILVAGGWGNYGDIPTSVIMSITGAAPFNGSQDQNLSVAYCSAFILVFMVTLFPLGGHRWIAKDYVGPEVEDDEVREHMRLKRKHFLSNSVAFIVSLPIRTSRRKSGKTDEEGAKFEDLKEKCVEDSAQDVIAAPNETSRSLITVERRKPSLHRSHTSYSGTKHVSFGQDDATTVVGGVTSPTSTEFMPSRVTSPAPTVTHVEVPAVKDDTLDETPHSTRTTKFQDVLKKHIIPFLRSTFSPPSISILVAFPIALITPLKALFIAVPHSPIPSAPDGQPPLAFIMDTATFIGGASVPLGLICLGSALARLKLPRGIEGWKGMPVGAITSFAIGKVVVMGVLGVGICEGLVKAGLINAEDKVLRFVCIFFSCLPTATTQVFLTQVYSGTGTAEHLSAFLIPQYIIMFISMTALTAYSLQLIF
ncbi:hypothetical protein JAAARDRAFT_210200 [Jaapia argillacea MUCL 33604]|uniref:Auxin efflux carrier n=1 Tax=Jaapia argillacea MUCL 33604 TaxID=933084 RepID=A0A067PRK5_9AGAM|nr:hypothetical protein JAAARDRAFT_210200 [Jaapia argillacea MUCL 33604]